MLVVALTGGIGSGKTTACRLFETLGTPIIDADLIARSLVEPGEPALDEITQQFGSSVLTTKGTLDRKRVRQLIFSDREKRHLLESILHPRIRREMVRRIAELTTPYCIVAIPLLVESGQIEIADRVLVIDTTESEQLQRVIERDEQTEEAVAAIISSQASRAARLALADDIIDNSGDIGHLQAQVESYHQKYLSIAKNRS
ncbi:MAG TPA: dephospho-CoA kinase [Chromatiales bacterium]|nr:dephospho-CoA kinase [Chromatiales bacterium]